MNRFEIVAPRDLAHASKLLAQKDHSALAGGVDLLDLMKQGVSVPRVLVNLKELKGLGGVEAEPDRGLRLGALAKLDEIAAHRTIRSEFSAIAEAADQTATPQIRNLATVGGNLLQRPRCWYFRNPDVVCVKKGGDKCYALTGLNRYHAIVGGGPAFIVHPSNLATALVAFGASARIAGPSGERTVELEKFFALPTVDPLRENALRPGEILVEILVPASAPATRSVYFEAREKQSADWPLVSVAVVLATAPGSRTVKSARIVMGAVAPIPWRAPAAEQQVIGAPLDLSRARAAAETALKDARPLSGNAYKVPIAKVMVRRALLKAGGIEEA